MSQSKAEITAEIKRFTNRKTRLEALMEMARRWRIVYEHLLQDDRFTTWWNENGLFTLKMRVNGQDRMVFQMSTAGALKECENPFLAAYHRYRDDPARIVQFRLYVEQRPWIFDWLRPDTYEELFSSVMQKVQHA